MGPCNSTKNRKAPKNVIEAQVSNANILKALNPHSTISGVNNQIIIKHINDINGDAIKIDRCKDSTIIIMDNSAQVIIFECTNCNFFIAPCKGSIMIRKSEKINIISASGQFRCSDVTNLKASLYVNSQPSFERAINLSIGCFFFMYTELPDLFYKAEMSIWDNCWSEYHDYTPSIETKIIYFNPKEDNNFTQIFLNALKDQEINVDQYFPVPYTFGLSTQISKSNNHLLFFFRESYVDSNKIYELINEEMMESLSTSLIKTCHVERSQEFVIYLQALLKKNNNAKKSDFFKNLTPFPNKNPNTSIMKQVTNINFFNGFVLMWLINENDNFLDFIEMINNEFENCLYITKDDVGNMDSVIKKIFPNFAF